MGTQRCGRYSDVKNKIIIAEEKSIDIAIY